jgi:D-alanyl-D-alanine carboxypeptidase/D-alanyl-D-alanine-endopeptidase (penicillin-binding protein 4)
MKETLGLAPPIVKILDKISAEASARVVLRMRRLSILLAGVLISSGCFAEDGPESDIAKLLKPYGSKAAFSLRSASGAEISSLNSQLSFAPASTAKLISSACVLNALGPDFRFETELGYTGSLNAGKLVGNLIVRASGDFSLVVEDLKVMVEQLVHIHGIKSIEGSIILDTSIFKKPELEPFEGFAGDKGRAFHARLTALPINHNAFSIWVVADDIKPKIKIFPIGSYAPQIKNELKPTRGRLGGSRSILDFRPDRNYLKMSGQVGTSDEVKVYYRSHPEPYASFVGQFRANFEALGGDWKASTKIAPYSGSFKSLLSHFSQPISKLLMDINKLSTNFGAEMSLLAASRVEKAKAVGSEDAADTLESCLKKFGIGADEIFLENASGLSRKSRLRASSLTSFLQGVSQKTYWPEFLSSLAVTGRDGTMKNRLQDLEGRGRLKTGTLSGVRSVAGYVQTPSGEWRSLSILLNCGSCDLGRWRSVENAALELAIRGAR